MTSLERVDTGFAPWSLMTPDPAKARVRDAKTPEDGASRGTATVHEDKRAPAVTVGDDYMFGDDGLTFGDFLDMVNPLQHLPVVGAVYRSLTDDQIDPGSKLAGGILYGGPLGLASAALNNALEEHTGNDVSGHALAFLGFGGEDAPAAEEALDAPIQQAAAGPLPGPAGDAASFLALDPRQAAALERFAARAQGAVPAGEAGAIAAPAGATAPAKPTGGAGSAGSIDQLVTASRAADPSAAAQKPADFGGIARISDQMARHLAQLAQSDSDPVRTLAAGGQAALTQQGARPQQTAALQTAGFAGGPMPLSITGEAPVANPFIGMRTAPAARAPEPAKPDPFDVALEQLGLRPPAAAENTPLTRTQAQTTVPSSAMTQDAMQPPPAEDVPAAMLSALKRYEAMQQEG